MDRRKLSRINRLGQEILSLQSRLEGVKARIHTARLNLDRDNLTSREWSESAHEYGVGCGSAFALEKRLQIVRGRFHFEASTI